MRLWRIPMDGGRCGEATADGGEVAYLRHAVEREMAESRHASVSLRVPGYVRVSSLRDEMRLSGCLYNRSSAVSLGVTCEAFA